MKWGVEVTSGGDRGQGELCCQEPHLLWPRLSTSMFLAFSSSRGHSVRSLRLKSWGMKAGIILSPGMGPPYHNYHPLPPRDHGASLGPRSRCSSVPHVSSKGRKEQAQKPGLKLLLGEGAARRLSTYQHREVLQLEDVIGDS